MFNAERFWLQKGRSERIVVSNAAGPLNYAAIIGLWRQSQDFTALFSEILAASPFEAFFWETPPFTRATTAEPFEMVLTDAPSLARIPADPSAFAGALEAATAAAVFPNLGGDAVLIAPTEIGPRSTYGHLAAFSRTAPQDQQATFWSMVGQTIDETLRDTPLWVSTSGLGVPWLHVRLDSTPKYYTHTPYRDAA